MLGPVVQKARIEAAAAAGAAFPEDVRVFCGECVDDAV